MKALGSMSKWIIEKKKIDEQIMINNQQIFYYQVLK